MSRPLRIEYPGGFYDVTSCQADGSGRNRRHRYILDQLGNRTVLGSSTFVEELLAEEEKVIQGRMLFKRKRTDVEEFIDVIGEKPDVTREEIVGGSQRQAASKARSMFCYLGLMKLGLKGRELLRALGLTPAAIHYAVIRGENLLRENKEVGEGVLKYLTNLATSP